MPDPSEAPWMHHPDCEGRIAQLEADVERLREALEAIHLVSQAESTAHLMSIESIARYALRPEAEGEPT